MSSNSTAFNNSLCPVCGGRYHNVLEDENAFPRLRAACSSCIGTVGHCKSCGTLSNWLDGKPIEYQSGNFHRCPNRRGS